MRSHLFVGIYFINKATNIFSFEIVCAKILFCQMFLDPLFTYKWRVLLRNLLRLYNLANMMQTMNAIVCWFNLLCLENSMTKNEHFNDAR